MDDLWIGLREVNNDGYAWVTQEPLNYKAWASGEPKAANGCVRLGPKTGGWFAGICAVNRDYLCERPVPGKP